MCVHVCTCMQYVSYGVYMGYACMYTHVYACVCMCADRNVTVKLMQHINYIAYNKNTFCLYRIAVYIACILKTRHVN